MSSIQLAEFVLWKSIKQKREDDSSTDPYSLSKKNFSEEIVFYDEMICRVCLSPGDIPIANKIDGIHIPSALRSVSNLWISSADTYPKYLCKTCFEELKVALNFKKKCETSDCFFNQTQPKKPQDCDSANTTIVKHDFAYIIQQMKLRRLGRSKHADKKTLKKKASSSNNFQETNGLRSSLLRGNKCKKSPPCPICGKIVCNLKKHIKNVHLREDECTCHICGKILYSPIGLQAHLLVHSDRRDYSCPQCPYKAKKKSYLTIHMRVHSGERPYLCSKCPGKFVSLSTLRIHTQRKHSNRTYECKKCNKQFNLLKSLEEHFDGAHRNIRYKCSICGREMWTRKRLLRHEIMVHKREKRKLYDELNIVVPNDDND